METSTLQTSLHRFDLERQRFESRLRFFTRCLTDIAGDFHKQYGPFHSDWEMTEEACQQYVKATEDYLRTRDIVAMEFKLLLGALEEAQTEYAIKKATKRFVELMEVCIENDQVTLVEIDEDIYNIRTVYRMIAVAECEREE
ncbi:hypothetical protein CL655_00995 [bacterium]|nr:hypothetical protein [bacterium]|tara:strand:+ start:1713 stop:2138 length:426 start_codon:yes stop_codon:yes gene_type:complete